MRSPETRERRCKPVSLPRRPRPTPRPPRLYIEPYTLVLRLMMILLAVSGLACVSAGIFAVLWLHWDQMLGAMGVLLGFSLVVMCVVVEEWFGEASNE